MKENIVRGTMVECMSFEEFCEYMKACLQERLGNSYHVTTRDVTKNNNVHLCALIIMEEGSNLSPSIYLENYFRQYQEGRNLEDVIRDVLNVFESCRKSMPDKGMDVSFFTEWENVKNRVILKLVNYEQNKELLNDVPHYRFLDLAVIFNCLIETSSMENATILIHSHHLDMWNISKDELYSIAKQNTPKLLPSQIVNMFDVMKEMVGAEVAESMGTQLCPMFVMTILNKINGATCLLYPDVLKKFAEKIGHDLIILPSSVREVILMPATDDAGMQEFAEMVREVNATQLAAEEVLSDHAYYFSRETNIISM